MISEVIPAPCSMVTNATEWNAICGSWTGADSYPLCYFAPDGEANFASFEAFGGWNKPYAKIYAQDAALGGTEVDLIHWGD
ncbi:hypothetical protein ACFYYB_33875 [Streptomyces sp. NPDC002886]|uniref:hypothetical protein n=1 Tax=Streptomyces sp. NPDC002886 TaxID=3364667 RepID=UPI0036894CC0